MSLDQAHDREPIHLRHLQVEEREIGGGALDERDRLHTALGFAHELHVTALAQQGREKCARGSFIVRDDYAQSVAHAMYCRTRPCPTSSACIAARRMRTHTSVPSSAELLISIVAFAP